MSKKFIRTDSVRYSKLGKGRKKLQKWRRPIGKSNKIRQKRAGYPSPVEIGYKGSRKESGKIMGLVPKLVHNLKELENVDKNSLVILARVGAKKKIEMVKKAEEMKIKVMNIGGKK